MIAKGRNGQHILLQNSQCTVHWQSRGYQFVSWPPHYDAGHYDVMTLGKLFTHTWLCH